MLIQSIFIILFGIALIFFAVPIYNFIGEIDFLERWFGNTKFGIQMFGLFIIILTIILTTGGLNFFIAPLVGVN